MTTGEKRGIIKRNNTRRAFAVTGKTIHSEEKTMAKGRFTIPVEENFTEELQGIARVWGADAVRDCDGTKLPPNGKPFEKVYNT